MSKTGNEFPPGMILESTAKGEDDLYRFHRDYPASKGWKVYRSSIRLDHENLCEPAGEMKNVTPPKPRKLQGSREQAAD